MNLSKLIKYNEAVFMVGGWFVKLWMITMPMFAAYIMYSTYNLSGGGWVITVWAFAFLLGYPIRNYLMVRNYMNGDYPPHRQKKVDEFKAYLNQL